MFNYKSRISFQESRQVFQEASKSSRREFLFGGMSQEFQEDPVVAQDTAETHDSGPITRRRFGGLLAAMTVAISTVIPGITKAQVAGSVADVLKDANIEDLERSALIDELRTHAESIKGGGTSQLNLVTAGLVSTIFGGVIVGSIAKYKKRDPKTDNMITKAQKVFAGIVGGKIYSTDDADDAEKAPFVPELGPGTAARVMGAEALRIGAMAALGDEHDKHLAKHEALHVLSDLVPAFILTTLSDLTTSELRVDVSDLLTEIIDDLLRIPDYKNIKRPEINAENINQWQRHLDSVNHDINRSAQGLMAVSYVLGPLLTTYTPSSVANIGKGEMTRMLYEQRRSQLVLQSLQNGTEFDDDAAFEEATAYTDKAMDGGLGYSKLLITLSCNTVGTWLAGDPPEAYWAIGVFGNDNSPEKVAETGIKIDNPLEHFIDNMKFGAGASAFFSLVFSNIWLAKTQKKDYSPKIALDAILDTLRTIRGLSSTVIRKIFGAQKRFRKMLETELASKEDGFGGLDKQQLQKILDAIPNPGMEFDGVAYFDAKLRALEAFAAKFKSSEKLQSLVNRSNAIETDSAELADLIREFRSLSSELDEEMSRIIEDLRTSDTTADDEVDIDEEREIQLKTKLASTLDGINGLLLKYREMDPEGVNRQLREELSIPLDADAEVVRKHLASLDKAIINRVYRKVFGLAAPEDAVPGEDRHHVEEPHTPHFITHSANEVLFALMTQIPAVNPLKTLLLHAVQPKRKADFSEEEIGDVADFSLESSKQAESPDKVKLRKGLVEMLQKINGKVAPADNLQIDELLETADLNDKAGTGKKIVDLIISTSENLTPDSLINSLLVVFVGAGTVMSSVADNVAAYLLCERTTIELFQKTFGLDVFLRYPETLKSVKILTKFLAEVAGSLTKIANGPNFSQKKWRIVRDKESPQGISLDQVDYDFTELMYHKNFYAMGANAMAVGYVFAEVKNHIMRIADDMKQEDAQAA